MLKMKYSITIVSDTVCPWCFVGYKRLQKGIAAFSKTNPGHEFEIKWQPFYLNPEARESRNKKQAYEEKFGADRFPALEAMMTRVGKGEGIEFSFGGNTGNTRDSHRLIQLAKNKGVQTPVVEALFHSYFEAEQDITSHAVLLEAGKKAGLESDEVKKWLESDDGGKEVDKEVWWAQRRGISGVPHFIINEEEELGGAQDPEAFVEVFNELNGVRPTGFGQRSGVVC